MNTGGANPEFVLRSFQGMNLIDGREAIGDEEFYWCENAIPSGSAALYPVNGPSPYLVDMGVAETGPPSYVMNFSESNVDHMLAVWKNSGNGWIVNLSTFAVLKIITGLTSGATFATQWSNLGVLIIDPTGYWDWNVTAPNTLTAQNNAAADLTLSSASTIAGGTSLRQIVVTAGGSGGSFQTVYGVNSVTLTTAGSGYAVGDTLLLTDNNPTSAASIVVDTIGALGAIATFTLTAAGSYPGPTSTTPAATGPTGSVIGGATAGTGAVFAVVMEAISSNILTRGTGYSTGDSVTDEFLRSSVWSALDSFTITSSGVIGGTGIATYAGRVWIASGRTVYFTDVDSYNSFGGAGGFFTITDSYLHNNITVLYAANNYLYIFGDTSIDALSNVTVTAGVTSFSRINVTASVGTSSPTSVFAYYRSIMFFHASGFYLLAGATPERISEKITSLIGQITAATPVFGCQVQVRTELCAAFLFTFTDTFVTNTTRTLMALFFRNRWWVAGGNNFAAMTSLPVAGVETAYAWAGNAMYQQFFMAGALAAWILKTKLWDGGSPLREKQSINAAIAGLLGTPSAAGIVLTVDTELASSGGYSMPIEQTPPSYDLSVAQANEGGTQYLGLTATGSTDLTRIDMLALRGKTERDFMQ
jgi:hypothetical protein